MKVQIPFPQLLIAVKTLTRAQRARLREELKEEKNETGGRAAFLSMLENGPVFTEKEIQVIEENHNSIAKWRTKS